MSLNSGLAFAGRRIRSGDVRYTDWLPVAADCLLPRAQCVVDGGGGTVDIKPATRADEGSTITPVTPTGTSLARSSIGFATAEGLTLFHAWFGVGERRRAPRIDRRNTVPTSE